MADRKPAAKDVPMVRRDGFHLPFFRKRAAFYFDGFNLYHSVQELGRPHLKWLDLAALARQIAPPSQVVKRVVWVTAYRPQGRRKMERHRLYHEALMARGVTCRLGHFVIYTDGCNACGHGWTVAEEKQSDVNLALSIVDDAHEDRFDVCYLVTTDGDHAATARYLKERFPHKTLVVVAPPRRRANRMLLAFADAQAEIDLEHLEASLLPQTLKGAEGELKRPLSYDPPQVPRRKGHLTLVSSDGS